MLYCRIREGRRSAQASHPANSVIMCTFFGSLGSSPYPPRPASPQLRTRAGLKMHVYMWSSLFASQQAWLTCFPGSRFSEQVDRFIAAPFSHLKPAGPTALQKSTAHRAGPPVHEKGQQGPSAAAGLDSAQCTTTPHSLCPCASNAETLFSTFCLRKNYLRPRA